VWGRYPAILSPLWNAITDATRDLSHDLSGWRILRYFQAIRLPRSKQRLSGILSAMITVPREGLKIHCQGRTTHSTVTSVR
jgi:hypothetical protein